MAGDCLQRSAIIHQQRANGVKHCTVKQAAILRPRGLPCDVSWDQADKWIREIKNNGWRMPDGLRGITATPAAEDRARP